MVAVGVPVRGGMAVRRLVAATDVTALHAKPEVHPATAHAQTVLATLARRRDFGDQVQMCAGIGHPQMLTRS